MGCASRRTNSSESAREGAASASNVAAVGSSTPGDPGARAENPPKNQREVAILAGGCFWGMEEILRSIPGVLETEVGYTGGGATGNASYDRVKTGTTGHAESVRIVFDPSRLSYTD